MAKVVFHICNKDRPTELALLLQSLRTQTYQDFNILILDDGSGTPLGNYYFIQYLVNRLKLENHNVTLIRNEFPSGVSKARQCLVDYTMKHGKEELICRVDDDCILDENYLFILIEKVINLGFDIASGVTPGLCGPEMKRNIRFVEPIIGECVLNDKGELIKNADDCGQLYLERETLPSHHFRSSALYKRTIHEAGVDYNSRLSKNGFREEQIFSFKAIIKGFKIGINTGAIAWHLLTPSGGERDTMNMTQFNQKVFEDTVKQMFLEHGNFIEDYNKRLGIETKKHDKFELLKPTNLVYKKEGVNLIYED